MNHDLVPIVLDHVIKFILKHLAYLYRVNVDLYQTIIHSFESARKVRAS